MPVATAPDRNKAKGKLFGFFQTHNPEKEMSDKTEMDRNIDQWLRDAHAMEQQADQMLKAQSGRIQNYPELSARIEQHLEETRVQRDRLETCMELRGISRSLTKDSTAQFTAMMQGFGGMFAGDEVIKGVMASYAFENMEIATYKVLSAAARLAGDQATAETCDEICRQEEAMAAWLEDHMQDLTRIYLTRTVAAPEEAKR